MHDIRAYGSNASHTCYLGVTSLLLGFSTCKQNTSIAIWYPILELIYFYTHIALFFVTLEVPPVLYLALGNINTSIPYQTAGEELKARSIQWSCAFKRDQRKFAFSTAGPKKAEVTLRLFIPRKNRCNRFTWNGVTISSVHQEFSRDFIHTLFEPFILVPIVYMWKESVHTLWNKSVKNPANNKCQIDQQKNSSYIQFLIFQSLLWPSTILVVELITLKQFL